MGTDIHGVWQRFDEATKEWCDVESSYDQDRHYQLFAVLAGVRNGTGFAGVITGDSVIPISEPRGFPAGFKIERDHHVIPSIECANPYRRKWAAKDENGDDCEPRVWMGEHSQSWLASDEMLAWLDTAPVVAHCGFVDRDEFAKRDASGKPSSWCGGISGRDVYIANSEEEFLSNPKFTHLKVYWKASLRDELAYFFDEVRRLHDMHGGVRFVFGFDS